METGIGGKDRLQPAHHLERRRGVVRLDSLRTSPVRLRLLQQPAPIHLILREIAARSMAPLRQRQSHQPAAWKILVRRQPGSLTK